MSGAFPELTLVSFLRLLMSGGIKINTEQSRITPRYCKNGTDLLKPEATGQIYVDLGLELAPAARTFAQAIKTAGRTIFMVSRAALLEAFLSLGEVGPTSGLCLCEERQISYKAKRKGTYPY